MKKTLSIILSVAAALFFLGAVNANATPYPFGVGGTGNTSFATGTVPVSNGSQFVGVPSSTFYLSSNPNGYVTSTVVPTGTVLSLGSPLIVGGNATSTIFGQASTNGTDNTSYIPELDRVYSVPLNYATAGCNGSSTLTDFGGCVNALYANAPSQPYYIGIQLPCSISVTQATWKTPIVFGNFGVRPSLFSLCGANLIYGGTGTAITWNFENPTGHLGSQDYGWTMQGQSTLITAGQTNTATTTGITCGGNFGCVGVNFHDLNVNGFGRNIATGANAYMDSWTNVKSSGGDCGGSGMTGCLFYVPGASNSGESFALNNFIATDPGNTTSGNAVYLTNGSVASFSWTGGSLDDAQMFIGSSNGSVSFPGLLHIENSDGSAYGNYEPIRGVSSDLSTSFVINDLEIANDFTGSNSFTTIVHHGGQLSLQYAHIDNYGGGTITNLVLHDLDNGLSSDHVCGVSVQGGSLTNIIGGSGGATYTQARGVGCSLNVANSYTIDIYPNGSNTNNIDSGNSTVGTFDHSGNWYFGNSILVGTSSASLDPNVLSYNGAGTGVFAVQNTAGNGYTAMDFYDSSSTKIGGIGAGGPGTTAPYQENLYLGTNSSSQNIVFLPNGTQTVTIGSTSTVINNNTLVDAGNTKFITSTAIGNATGTAFYFPFWGSGGTSLSPTSSIYQSGTQIVIGTSTPHAALTVGDSGTGFVNIGDASSFGAVGFSSGTLTTGNASIYGDGQRTIISSPSTNIEFRAAGNFNPQAMFINGANQNVGVHTNVPSSTFHVVGTGIFSTSLSVATNTLNVATIDDVGSLNVTQTSTFGATSTFLGNVSVGTSSLVAGDIFDIGTSTLVLKVNTNGGVTLPTGNLTLTLGSISQTAVNTNSLYAVSMGRAATSPSIFSSGGTLVLGGNSTGNGGNVAVMTTNNTAPYAFYVASTTGYVGVNTNAPSSTFHVVGDGIFSNTLAVGTTTTSTASINDIGSLNVSQTSTFTQTSTFQGNVSTTITNSFLATNGSGVIVATSTPAPTPAQTLTTYGPVNTFWSDTTNNGTTTLNVTAVEIPYNKTLTGISFATWDVAAGSSTVGLYNFAGTLVASSTAANLSGTFAVVHQAFQSTFAVTPGVWYISMLNSKSSDHFVGVVASTPTNSFSQGGNVLPTTITTSSMTTSGIIPMLSTY
jgi:hypothetical protein